MLALPFDMPVSRTSKAAVLDGVVAKGQSGLVFRGAPVDEACAERVLGLIERRGILSSYTVAEMQGWGHRGGFSVHAGVRVAAPDRAGRERLLRYCARPMFAGELLVWFGGGRKCATGCHGRRWRGTGAGSKEV